MMNDNNEDIIMIDGFHRSRILWDRVRRQRNAQSNNNNTNSNNNNNNDNKSSSSILYYKALYNAILYEIQPIRYHIWIQWIHTLKHMISDIHVSIMKQYHTSDINISSLSLLNNKEEWMINIKSFILNDMRTFIIQYWKIILVVVCYYIIVRFIHETIHAGPIVIIITLLVIIFTIGLDDDNKNKNDENYLSAYSVFNKGFQKLMGTVDADALVAQHIGGGGGMMMNMMMMNGGGGNGGARDNNDNNDNFIPDHHNERPRRQQQPQQQQHDDDDIDQENNDIVVEQPNQQQQRARKSNKKSRRKVDIEQRREIRRQREAAIAMGIVFQDDDDDDNDNDGFLMNEQQFIAFAEQDQ